MLDPLGKDLLNETAALQKKILQTIMAGGEQNRSSKDRLINKLREQLAELEKITTELKKAERAFQEGEETYRSLVDSTDDSIYLVDFDCRYLFMNKKHMLRLGLLDGQYNGAPYSAFHAPQEANEFAKKVTKVFKTGESIQCEQMSQHDKRCYLRTFSPVRSADGTIRAVSVVSKDITERKQMEEKLRALSMTDELTGLFNRRGFHAFAEQQLKLSKRLKKGLYMLYADLDNLKFINDTFGHKEGDVALVIIAGILRECFRDSDVIARVGGDEFAIIPIGVLGDNVENVVGRLVKKINEHNAGENIKYRISLSIGTALYDPAAPCSIEELLMRADKAMYEQKRNKKMLEAITPDQADS